MTSTSSSNITKKTYHESVTRNTQLFGILSHKLTSERPREYIEAARVLTKWLLPGKAYYPEAKEHIVAMLEAASWPLVRALRLSETQVFHVSMCKADVQEQATAYINLVLTVEPHLHRFTDDNLKTRLVNVISTVHVPPPSKKGTAASSPNSNVNQATSTTESIAFRVGSSRAERTSDATMAAGHPEPNIPIPSTPVLPSPKPTPVKNLSEKHVESSTGRESPRRPPPHKLTDMADCANVSSTTQCALPCLTQPTVPQNLIKPSSLAPPQSTKVAMQTVSENPPDPKAPLPVKVGARPSFPSKYLHLAALDLKSFKHKGSNVKVRSSDEKSVSVPSVSSQLSMKMDESHNGDSGKPSRLGSDHKQSGDKPDPEADVNRTTFSETVPEMTPRAPNFIGPQDSVPEHSEHPSTPTLNSNIGDLTPKTASGGPLYPETASQQEVASVILDQTAIMLEASAVQAVVPPLRTYTELAVRSSPNHLLTREDEQQPKTVIRPSSSSSSQNGVPRTVASQQPPHAEAPKSSPSLGPVALSDRKSEHTLQSSDIIPLETVTSASGLAQQAEPLAVDHLERIGDKSSDSIHERQPSVGSQSMSKHGHSPTPGRLSIGAWSDDMAFSPAASPGPSTYATSTSVDKTTLSSSTIHQPAPSTITGPNKEREPEAQSSVSGGMTDECTKQAIPELKATTSPSSGTAIGAPLLASQHLVLTGSVLEVPQAESTVIREADRATPVLNEATDGANTGANTPNHHPKTRLHPLNQTLAQATNEDVNIKGNTSNVAAALSSSGKKAEHLTVLAKHFLQAQNEEDPQRRVLDVVHNMGKIISSLPPQEVEKIVRVAKAARAMEPASGHDAVKEFPGRTERDAMADNSQLPQEVRVTTTPESDIHKAGPASPQENRKRRRSQSLDAGSDRPSVRPKNSDMAPTTAEARNDAIDLPTEPAQKPSPVTPLKQDDMTLADAPYLAPGGNAIPTPEAQTIPVMISGEGTAMKENPPENVDVVKQRQDLSSPCADIREENTLRQGSGHKTLGGAGVLGPLSYHPSLPFQIVAIIEGSSVSHVHEVDLELDEHQAAMVSRWNDRYNNYNREAPCITVTMICSRLSEIENWSESNPGTNAEEATRNVQIQWPTDRGLWVTLQHENLAPVSLSLSPPIIPNEPIDLSPNIGPRTTKIRLTQSTDLSDFVFVIRAHRPTEAQLHELLEANRKKLAWRNTLSRLSLPLKPIFHANLLATTLEPVK